MPVLETILFLTTCGLGLNAAKRLGDDDGGPTGVYAPPPQQPNWSAYQASAQPYRPPSPYGYASQSDEFHIGKDHNNQFIAQVVLIGPNGKKVPTEMLVDTGATHSSLTHQTAKALGISLWGLNYNRKITTASGIEVVAEVTIPEMTIRDVTGELELTLSDIPTLVCKRDCKRDDLLGMSTLREVSATFERDTLVLRA